MTERLLELVLDESKWLTAAMVVSLLAVCARLREQLAREAARRETILWAMVLFHGVLIGTLAFGHLLAVALHAARGTLSGSPWVLFPLGVALAVPSWWLVLHVRRPAFTDDARGARWARRTIVLEGALAAVLLGLGLHNFPLALPAGLNIAYQRHSRRVVGWTLVALAAAGALTLFVGSLVFLASGQSFEAFREQ